MQPVQRGTGHALQMVKAWFAQSGEPVPENLLVLSGDVPLIRPETIRELCEVHLRENAAMTILTAVPPDPTGYGRVLRASPTAVEVTAIVEQKSLRPEQMAAPEINSGIYCFQTQKLFANLDALSTNNAHGEFYLTDVAAMLVAEGSRVVAVQAESVDEVLGANTIAEMMHLDAAMRAGVAKRLMAQGVTIFRPDTCVIDASVEVAADTVIEPYVQLLGATRIGSECRIRSYSVLQDSTLGHQVTVRNGCILNGAEVADGAILGPYAHLRPESRIGENAHVGNFVETKKITLGQGIQSQPSQLSRRCRDRRRRQYRGGGHHLQLRWRAQARDPHRRRRVRRVGFDVGCASHHRRRRLRCRRVLYHRRCSSRRTRIRPGETGGQERLGSKEESGAQRRKE